MDGTGIGGIGPVEHVGMCTTTSAARNIIYDGTGERPGERVPQCKTQRRDVAIRCKTLAACGLLVRVLN